MKSALVILAVVLASSQVSAQQCQRPEVECGSLRIEWIPSKGFNVFRSAGSELSQLDEDICIVQTLCPGVTVNEDGVVNVPNGGIPVPRGYVNTSEMRQQLGVDCQAVVSSQTSNICYEQDVWATDASKLYPNE